MTITFGVAQKSP